MILSEYYKYGEIHKQWYCDATSRSAIAVKPNLPIDDVGTGNKGYVWVTTGGMRIYSCYWSPNTPDAEYEQFLRRLEASIRTSPLPIVVAGDFNAKHSS